MWTDYELSRREIIRQDRIDRHVAIIRRAFWTLIVTVAILDLASFYGCEAPPKDPPFFAAVDSSGVDVYIAHDGENGGIIFQGETDGDDD